MRSFRSRCAVTIVLSGLMMLLACDRPRSGEVRDEASQVGRPAASFAAADDEKYFRDMDGGVPLSKEESIGRNTWLVWTGGNDRFWDEIIKSTFGTFDLLKIVSSHPSLAFSRDNRWTFLGLVNEPCFEKATGPDPDRFGLWLDKRKTGPGCPQDPFADPQKYPGVAIGARGQDLPIWGKLPIGSYYGEPTGIVGLRLFPNPAFDADAARKWDPERYYNDPSYYLSKDLVRPYRVGMSCAFCHVGPSPIKPPQDPENPKWENLSSVVGAQYFWFDRVFVWDSTRSQQNFVFQLLHTMRPGALDTSLVSTDNINNPRTMNAFYGLGPRLEVAERWGKEALAGGELNNKQFNDYFKEGPLTEFFQKPDTVFTPHVLKDGSDSVGALGALNRVYLNIGLFSEEWLLHFNPFVGGKPITPIEIATAERNSEYWKATEAQAPNLALFLLKAGAPHHLKDAPGGARYLTGDPVALERGKVVFAERCARCHSSKVPRPAAGLDDAAGCAGPTYLQCWNKYWAWTKTDEFKQKMREIVLADDFLNDNYLSTDVRVPVTLLQTNACSPLATNALAGNIWDNFSSQSYKDLPSVGSIELYNPFTGQKYQYAMPAGGRGYTRPPSLISVWSTAPFLLNNTLGLFDPDPSVDARMRVFQASIEQLLWPERRERDPIFPRPEPGAGLIDRTTVQSYLSVPAGFLPYELSGLGERTLNRWLPWIFTSGGDVRIGPIPKGTPVNLLGNLALLAEEGDAGQQAAHYAKVLDLLLKLKHTLGALPRGASDEQAAKVLAPLTADLLALSKCPDFVVNKGHYFGTAFFDEEPGLTDAAKSDLIEFLKTF